MSLLMIWFVQMFVFQSEMSVRMRSLFLHSIRSLIRWSEIVFIFISLFPE